MISKLKLKANPDNAVEKRETARPSTGQSGKADERADNADKQDTRLSP